MSKIFLVMAFLVLLLGSTLVSARGLVVFLEMHRGGSGRQYGFGEHPARMSRTSSSAEGVVGMAARMNSLQSVPVAQGYVPPRGLTLQSRLAMQRARSR